jgi:hypothetical protein
VALTLLQAETNARTLTRHDSDTRFSQAQWRIWAHEEYRKLRTWLQGVAPELYLLTSSDQPVAEGGTVTLATVSATLERIHVVEWDAGGSGEFRSFERADSVSPSSHKSGRFTFRVENGVVKFGPDGHFEGTVRVKYWGTPATLTNDVALFELPTPLEQPLILRTCGWIAIRDGEGAPGKKAWDDAADTSLKEALPALKAQHGAHPRRAGLQLVLGY